MKFSSLIIGLILGFCAGYFWKRIKQTFVQRKKPADKLEKETEPQTKEEAASNPVPETKVKEAEKPDLSSAKEQFIHVQEMFTGTYESLYQATKTPGFELSDWHARMEVLKECPDLQMLMQAIGSDPSKVLNFVMSCGVERDERSVVVADESTRYQYVEFDGADIVVGTSYQVLLPFWHNGATLLGKGILKPLE